MRALIEYPFIALIVAVVLSQFQPLLLRSAGAIDGSFGVRPTSHKCLGLTLEGLQDASRLPLGDVEFQFGLFHFRYAVTEKDLLGQRQMCVGQDLWFGE